MLKTVEQQAANVSLSSSPRWAGHLSGAIQHLHLLSVTLLQSLHGRNWTRGPSGYHFSIQHSLQYSNTIVAIQLIEGSLWPLHMVAAVTSMHHLTMCT